MVVIAGPVGGNEGGLAMTPEGRKRAGKSLVELLVALAIIALMMALMLPAAMQALKAAQALVS